MSGETNLDVLLGTMEARLDPEVHVFANLAPETVPDGIVARMRFEEPEGTTLILTETEALARGIPHEFRCRMITLEVHSALNAVGFIARIASALAQEGMGVNPVAGYYHDHLFVPDGREADALRVLENLRKQAATRF